VNGSGFRPTGPSSAGELKSISLVGGNAGIVSGPGVVSDVINSSVAAKQMSVADLGLRVIPMINNLKVQIVEVQTSTKEFPSMLTVFNQLKTDVVVLKTNFVELRNNYVALNEKYRGLDERLVKANVALKSLDDWSVTYDFSRRNHGLVPFPISNLTVAPLTQLSEHGYVPPGLTTPKVDEGLLLGPSNSSGLSFLDFDNLIV